MSGDEDASDELDLQAAEDELQRVVRYFEEVEQRLEAQSGAPVHLVEMRSAWRAWMAVSQFLEAERERNRAWKHADPSEVALEFIGVVAAFVKENGLSWAELAEHLHLDPGPFVRLADFAYAEPPARDN
jgi:hypothetical protein